jgi:adenylate kinase family enzyme
MPQDWRHALSHVLWIGGATDSGKSTAAQKLAQRHLLQFYHYDKRDLAHHEQLAKTIPAYRDFLDASLDERWVYPEPEELLQRTLRSFQDRFSLVIEDLLALPKEQQIVAEGFGLLPEFLAPLLSGPAQALWLVSTAEFKRASMLRRGKPSFRAQVSDPERAKANLYRRDLLLADYLNEQVVKYGYTVYEVDGSDSPEELTNRIEQHFAAFLSG